MLTSIISNTKWCHSIALSCNFVRTCLFCFDWQMLLPLFVCQNLADVIAIGFVCGWCRTTVCFMGRCYCHMLYVTDVIVTFNVVLWLMLLSLVVCDWCYYHIVLLFLLVGRCYAMWCGTTLLLQEGIETCPWLVLLPFFCSVRLTLLPFVIIWLMLLPVADAIATYALGWCYCLGGRCYMHPWVSWQML